jgi:thioredoxin
MTVIEATAQNFDQLIQGEYVMVDFYGDHCGACAFTAPFLRQAASDMAYITFVKVNTTHQSELAKRFDIKALPTFVYFRKGKEVYRNAGGMTLETIHKELSKLLYRI